MNRSWFLTVLSVVAIAALAYAQPGDRLHFLDGYVWAYNPTSSSYTAIGTYSYDRMGGPIQITRSGTGLYKAKFNNLSPLLSKSIVRVTGYNSDTNYCNGTQATLGSNAVGVHCFNAATNLPANAFYTVAVTRNYTDNAFAFANQPTGSGYVPPASTAWNPQGAIHVIRTGIGSYEVAFSGLGNLTGSNGGHFQAQAVGTASSYCNVGGWGGSPELDVSVLCYSGAGAALDTDFNVLFELPSLEVAYVWANDPASASYTPDPYYSWNPSGGGITITRSGTGQYNVSWSGLSLLDGGDVQVTAYGSTNAQCKVVGWGSSSVNVMCFTPGGTPVDIYFDVFFGS